MNQKLDYGFPTVFGRNLLEELKNFVPHPFLVVTMKDFWPTVENKLQGANYGVYYVDGTDEKKILQEISSIKEYRAVVGIGGGQAIDVAKYIAWQKQWILFQIPTILSVNAMYGQRSGVRRAGKVYYVGWAVPETVFIDYDIIQSAPKQLNYSGIGDVLCFHTGVLDWQYADKKNRCEPKWKYDPFLARQSLEKVDNLLSHLDDVHQLNEQGIQVLIDGLKWGTSFHGSGWNPRHIEGIDHFFFYNLEYMTGIKFLHGQPVCLGIYLGSLLHNQGADKMLNAITTVGLDIRPQAMGVTWEDVDRALKTLKQYVEERGLWYGIAHDADFNDDFVGQLKENVEKAYH